jgi:hypothetical protein
MCIMESLEQAPLPALGAEGATLERTRTAIIEHLAKFGANGYNAEELAEFVDMVEGPEMTLADLNELVQSEGIPLKFPHRGSVRTPQLAGRNGAANPQGRTQEEIAQEYSMRDSTAQREEDVDDLLHAVVHNTSMHDTSTEPHARATPKRASGAAKSPPRRKPPSLNGLGYAAQNKSPPRRARTKSQQQQLQSTYELFQHGALVRGA